MANTHYPLIARRGKTLILNPGSCGLPRDDGDQAACAVYDTAAHTARIFRVAMDPRAVLERFDPSLIHADVAACLLHRKAAPAAGTVQA
jgi:hypothetical protein